MLFREGIVLRKICKWVVSAKVDIFRLGRGFGPCRVCVRDEAIGVCVSTRWSLSLVDNIKSL